MTAAASDLADLNLALKMESQLNMKDDVDAFENYQSAIDSWETGLLSRHASRTATSSSGSRKSSAKSSGPSPRNNSATYKSSDPVSAAYFSQFRPSSRSTQSASSGTSSPKSRFNKQNSSTRADEVKAVYGLSSRDAQTGGSALSSRRRTRASGSDVARGSSGSGSRSSNVTGSRPSASAGVEREREREREREARSNPRPSSGTARKTANHYLDSGSPTQSSFQKKPSIVTSAKSSSFKRQHRIVSNPAADKTTPEYNPDSDDLSRQSSSSKKVSDAATSDRPESRKLYLGGGVGGGSGAVLGPNTTGQELTLKVPRSAGSKKIADNSSSTTSDQLVHGEEEESRMRASSFSGMCSPAPWRGDNLDDRPPSRQRSAFPTHLGEALDLKRRNPNAPSTRNTDAFSKEPPPSNDLHPQHQHHHQQQVAAAQGLGPTLSRPPSRQRLNAQHLWSGKPDGELRPPSPDYSSDGNEYSDRGSQDLDVSPVLTAYQSAASFDLQDDPSADKIAVSMMSRSPSPQIALGPMYDPFADGFSQLDGRGSTAPPFKIRYNQSISSTNTSRQKPSSASSKGSVHILMPSGGKEVDFNECEVVEEFTEHPPPTRGTTRKGSGAGVGSCSPNISASCQSSPSPEQVIESYSAWRSDSSSPSPQLTRSKSTAGKEKEEAHWPMSKSSSQASVFARSFSPSNQRIGLGTAEGGRNRAFVSGGEVSGSQSPAGSPVSSRFRNRNLASNLDDMSFADEELTVMTNCSEADLENGNDVNMFGEQLSQSIMLESSLGQDFLNLFAPSD
eukprot:CAMPEP_0114429584 /NCGR_PEP_ID=MMETSP0103-20121206/9569_1 /TAXON_ID=37642 ORGANISM="Paraphysomonas imperforata, Strain PA2" /NCGR_SAMPLE_ID=MMETSP0103 /ASSEMBLY_ACC=CAM_ASM_000201 /LENGTH=788 /DNA_ID=CAMNT_0001598941 /DNA_START=280 /DNA_END=2645 /DNA_ORIENTATION=-